MRNTTETQSPSSGDEKKRREADVSEYEGGVVVWSEEIEKRKVRKAEMVEKLKQLGTDADAGIAETENLAGGERFEAEVAEMERDIAECRRTSKITNDAKLLERNRSFINAVIVFICFAGGVGAVGNYIDSLYKKQEEREKAACELLQKGQPLPDAPSEVQLPAGDFLYKLVDECEITHGVDIAYGCAAQGILRTAGLNHEPSEISEDIKHEALHIAQEVKCNQ